MNELIVRASTEADVARCAEIYGHHVLYGTASFEVDPPDLAEMRNRRAAVLDLGLPHLVAERDGRVLGYAYAGKWRPRPAYAFSVEDSVYIDKDAVGQGVGKALLPVLIEQCTALGKRQMVAVIGDSAQTPSIRLHASCGFEMVGTLKSIGFKFGRWLDGVLMQRPLGPGDTLPPADTALPADTRARTLKELLLAEHPRGELNIPSRRKS